MILTKHLYILLLITLASASFSWSQSDQSMVHWQKSLGAQGEDALNDMVKDSDNNFYVVGSTQTAGSQTVDILISKFSASGIEIWSKTIGESGDDRGIAIELINNQPFVLASSTSSTGIFAGNHGREDIYLIRLNASGNLLGSSHYGGNFADIPTDLSKTASGDLLIAAHSKSTEGFFDINKGQNDMWIVRVNDHGDLIWKRNYGGMDEDFSTNVHELPNGEIVFSGHSASFDGDISVNYGDFDLSLFKLTSNGAILWERNYGGQQSEISIDLLINEEGHIFMAGNTQSLSFDVSKNAGFSDAWVLEINALNGAILWEATHGSEFSDYATSLKMGANNQLYLMGTTNAPMFHGEQSNGNEDAWLAHVNSPESINHLALFGGDGFESVCNFCVNSDGSILMIGTSNSQNDLFSTNKGKSDGWISKLELNTQNSNLVEAVSAHPNPTSGMVYLNHLQTSDEIIVYNSMGQIVESFQATAFTQVLDLRNVTSGVYLVKVNRGSGTELIRVVKE